MKVRGIRGLKKPDLTFVYFTLTALLYYDDLLNATFSIIKVNAIVKISSLSPTLIHLLQNSKQTSLIHSQSPDTPPDSHLVKVTAIFGSDFVIACTPLQLISHGPCFSCDIEPLGIATH